MDQAGNDEEVSAVEKNLEDIQKELDEKWQKKNNLKGNRRFENQVEELNRKAPTYPSKEHRGGQKLEQREAFDHYLRTKQVRAEGLKSTDGEPIIPVEVMAPKEGKQDKTDLTSLVNVVNVKNASGKWSVVKLTDQEMNTVEELEENPSLAKPKFTKVNYEIKTRRGHLPVSQEIIDDAEYDVMGLVAKQARNQERITKNKEIAKVLKTATAKSAAGLDGLKDILNLDLKPYYDATIVCTQTMFAALDKIKDKRWSLHASNRHYFSNRLQICWTCYRCLS